MCVCVTCVRLFACLNLIMFVCVFDVCLYVYLRKYVYMFMCVSV